MSNDTAERPPRNRDQELPRRKGDRDETPDTPPTEPQPVPVKEPPPDPEKQGPYVVED